MQQAGVVDLRGSTLCVYILNSFSGKVSNLFSAGVTRERMYALVRFLEDESCFAVPVSSVRDFRPVHTTDFDEQKVYVVLRGDHNTPGLPAPAAHILALAGKTSRSLYNAFYNAL